jgi:hypothetical protein
MAGFPREPGGNSGQIHQLSQGTIMADGSKKFPANVGLNLGIAIATAISWSVNHSIPRAILHGFPNWT